VRSENEIDRIMAKLDAHEYRVCLTTTTDIPNFRLKVLPTYKGKRSNVRKPLVLKPVRQWLIEGKYKALVRPTLEGDDVMGILATWSGPQGREDHRQHRQGHEDHPRSLSPHAR
jgi:hypothetical protein